MNVQAFTHSKLERGFRSGLDVLAMHEIRGKNTVSFKGQRKIVCV